MDTEYKAAELVDLKLDTTGSGSFIALFAPFERWDKSGDWTERNAFGRQSVVISSYGHGSTIDGRLPVGKGMIYDGPDGGIVEGKFFLNTSHGIDTYNTVKELGELQEWSYYLPEVVSEIGTREGRKGRILKKIKVQEVCPVLRGMGNGTHTMAVKTVPFTEHWDKAVEHSETDLQEMQDVSERLFGRMESRKSHSQRPRSEDLRRARFFVARYGPLVRKFEGVLHDNDAIDEAIITLQSYSTRKE